MKSRVCLYRSGSPRLWLLTAISGVGLAWFGTLSATASEEPIVLNIWPGQPPGDSPGSIGEENVREAEHGGHRDRFITNVTKPTITTFRPTGATNGTAVVICPGGGYSWLAWDREGETVAKWLNSLGVTGIILKYRVAPAAGSSQRSQPPPEPLQDAQRALSLVRSKASEWKLDPKRIGIIGFSAGGHLAAALATNSDLRTYKLLDAVDSVSCRPDFAVLIYPAYLITEGSEALVPMMRVRKDCPPTFFVHAANDHVLATNSVALFSALRHAGVPAELHVYATGGHGFGMGSGATASWPALCAEWMGSR